MRNNRFAGAFALAAAIAALAGPSFGATFYWDADGSTVGDSTSTGANLGASGTWSTAVPNWWDGIGGTLQNWSNGNDAVFWGTAGTVTNGGVSASNLTFKSNGYIINGSTLTMTGAPSNFTLDSGVTATIGSVIAGSASLIKLGLGTLVLSNPSNTNTADTTSGGWRIEGGGVLEIADDTSLGATLPDTARNTVTDIQLNQSTIRFDADMIITQNRRTKLNTNSSTQNLGDAVFDVNQHTVSWFGSIQGGFGTIRVTDRNDNGGMLILGTDKISSINPFGSVLPAGTVNLTVENHCVVQTAGTVTLNGGELGSETGAGGAPLAILLQNGGQIRSESGGYTFQRNLILGPGGGTLDTGAWQQQFSGGTVSGPGSLGKFGTGTLIIDNPSASWMGGTNIHSGTFQLGVGGSNGLLPGTLASPSSVVIDSGATLRFLRGSNKSFFDIISGAGNVNIAGSATVRLVSDNTYTGLTTISAGTLMIGQGNAGEPGSIVSNVVDNSSLVFNRVEDVTYNGVISGSGSVTKQAAGSLKLTGAQTYTGSTTVSKGKLLVAGSLANTAISVSGGAALGGTGSIAGMITLAAGNTTAAQGSLDLRDPVLGNLTLNDANASDTALTIGGSASDSPSLLNFDVGATADLIQITNSKLLVNAGGGVISINPVSGFGVGVYDLIQFPAGQASGLDKLVLNSGNLPSSFIYSLHSTATSEQFVVNTPEPSAAAVLLGVPLLLRRRKKS